MLAAVPWGTVTPLGALVVILVLLIRSVTDGKLVPGSLVEARITDKDSTIERQSTQIDALLTAQKIDAEAQAELRAQVTKLVASGQTTDAVLRAIGARAEGATT